MRNTKKVLAGGVLGVALLGAASGLAFAGVGDDNEEPITGEALEKASAAALAHTGEGRVTDTEQGDEDAFYEVEVTLNNGKEVDVHLDKQFKVVGVEAESGDEKNGD